LRGVCHSTVCVRYEVDLKGYFVILGKLVLFLGPNWNAQLQVSYHDYGLNEIRHCITKLHLFSYET